MKSTFKFLTQTAAVLSLAGCASRRQTTQPQFVPPPPPQAIVFPQGGPPYPVPGGPPAGAFPATPPGPGGPGRQPAPPTTPPGAFPTAPPMAPPSSAPAPAPDRVGYRWEGEAVPPSTPTPSTAPAPQSASPNVLLLPPVPESGAEKKQEIRKTESPEPATADSFPVGIAGFDKKARENVAAGERPSLEGLDWLKNAGYRTVVFLHLPNQPTDADRKQVESRGMTFVAIEINPRDLNRESVDRFLRVQSENPGEKKFVYDMDGSVTGAMWYLTFRLVDMNSDDTARARAGSLGQGENRDAARDLWQSVRKYVEQQR